MMIFMNDEYYVTGEILVPIKTVVSHQDYEDPTNR